MLDIMYDMCKYILRCVIFRVKIPHRHYAKLVREQDPKEVENMPTFDYIPENKKYDRRIYLWGNANTGALGKASFIMSNVSQLTSRSMQKPMRHEFADKHKVKDIACGYGFTVIAASNQDTNYSLFGMGLNDNGQIGYHCRKRGRPLSIIAEPVPIALPLLNLSTKAIHVSCGRSHTILVTDKEGAFGLGNNVHGQCGSSNVPSEKRKRFFRVHKIEIDDVSKVVCGLDHTLFLTKSGLVYSCGCGTVGQTGLGHFKDQFLPSRVIGDIIGEKIIKISCAGDTVLALSENGDVFCWGNSEYNLFESVTENRKTSVARNLNLNLGKIKDIAAAQSMCAIVTDNGCVYVWGFGILGQGPAVTMLTIPSLLPPPLFGYNEFSSDIAVDQIEAGLHHFAAITNKGHLYMWGRNQDNCLGLGRQTHQYFPYRVAVPAEVLKISCGVDHTAVLCKAFS